MPIKYIKDTLRTAKYEKLVDNRQQTGFKIELLVKSELRIKITRVPNMNEIGTNELI